MAGYKETNGWTNMRDNDKIWPEFGIQKGRGNYFDTTNYTAFTKVRKNIEKYTILY